MEAFGKGLRCPSGRLVSSAESARPWGGICTVVAVAMNDFCWSRCWERGADDTAELRDTVVFSITVIQLHGTRPMHDRLLARPLTSCQLCTAPVVQRARSRYVQ